MYVCFLVLTDNAGLRKNIEITECIAQFGPIFSIFILLL
jgi:hypothetical protein